MKKFLLLALFCAAGACAQTTVTVTVTLPTVAGPIATAWILSQCPVPLVSNACPTPPWANVQAMVKDTVAQAVQARLQQILQWAITNNDASLPGTIRTAITNAQTAQTTLATVQAAANPTVN